MFDYIKFRNDLESDVWKRSGIQFRIMHSAKPREDEFLNYEQICERAAIQEKEEAFKAQLDTILRE